ncbi:MAG: glycoside hydrolase family 30 protein [Bacilli bacterium]|jgi:glucosylceramidase
MNRKLKCIVLPLAIIIACTGCGIGLHFLLDYYINKLSPYVQVYETTGTKSQLLTRQSDIAWRPYEFSGNLEVNVDAKVVKNVLQGTGVALTHASAYLLDQADPSVKTELLNDLFGESGARFNLVRFPIGTSDYTPTDEFYSLDDMPEGATDYDLAHFSTLRDEEYLIPILQEALLVNPDLEFLAAPWSAPAWMKTNENLVGGYLKGHSDTVLSPEEKAYAAYLVAFVEGYADHGITIDYLSLLNEPTIANVSYPSMQMGTAQYIRVAKEVAALLKSARLKTKIMAYDHNVGSSSDLTLFEQFATSIEEDPDLLKRVSGYAFHGYGAEWPTLYDDVLSANQERYPKLENYLTEITESSHSVDFATNLSWSSANVTVGPMSYGSSMAVYWNAVLTETGEPVLGNEPDCFGMITLQDGLIKKNASYYSFAHLSQFAYPIEGKKPQRIDAYSDNEAKIKSVAFKRHDGTFVFVLANNDATTYEDVDVVFEGQVATYRVQPESLVTLLAVPGRLYTEPNQSLTYEHVDITQKARGRYQMDVTVASDVSPLSFFMTVTDKFDPTKTLEITNHAGRDYTFGLEADPGDYYLWMASGEKSGMLPLTLPSFSPTLEVEGTTAVIAFNLDVTTSWSSFCDPYGKAVYRSHKPTFDAEAEQVNVTSTGKVDPIYILTESYTDDDYDEGKPYYYLVMDGKNGLMRFVSHPLLSDERLFAVTAVTLGLESGNPLMRLEGVLTGLTPAESFRLVIKDSFGERHQAANQADDGLEFAFDPRLLEKTGVWYDINIENIESGVLYDIAYENVIKNNLTYLDQRINFQEWAGSAKLNKDQLAYTQTEADLLVVETVPYLKVSGHKAEEAVATMRLTYWSGTETVVLTECPDTSETSSRFLFECDLSALNEPGTYYDIVIVIDGVPSDLTGDMAINIADTVQADGRDYYFRTWEGLLKVVYDD